MGEVFLEALGVSAGKLRLQSKELSLGGLSPPRSIEERALPSWDEDALTLAVESALRVVRGAHRNPSDLGLVVWAHGGGEGGGALLSEAIGSSAFVVEVGGERTSLVDALFVAEKYTRSEGRPSLVVVSDVPRHPPLDPKGLSEGALSSSALLGTHGGIPLRGIGSSGSYFEGGRVVDREGFLRTEETGEADEEALEKALRGVGFDPSSFRIALSPSLPVSRRFPRESLLSHSLRTLGDGGIAHPLVELAFSDLSTPTLLLTQESGVFRFLLLGAPTLPVPVFGKKEIEEEGRRVSHLRALLEQGLLSIGEGEEPMGAFVPPSTYSFDSSSRYRLEGRECSSCGEILFPPRTTCSRCGGSLFRPRPLEGRGKVYSYTWSSRAVVPGEYAREGGALGTIAVGIVELREGPKVVARFTDVEPGGIEVGSKVELTFRRLYRQRGRWRYGIKFRPSREEGDRFDADVGI